MRAGGKEGTPADESDNAGQTREEPRTSISELSTKNFATKRRNVRSPVRSDITAISDLIIGLLAAGESVIRENDIAPSRYRANVLKGMRLTQRLYPGRVRLFSRKRILFLIPVRAVQP